VLDKDIGAETLEPTDIVLLKVPCVPNDADEDGVDFGTKGVFERRGRFGLVLVFALEVDLVLDESKDTFEEVVALGLDTVRQPLFEVDPLSLGSLSGNVQGEMEVFGSDEI
jgi:hypothetical protein